MRAYFLVLSVLLGSVSCRALSDDAVTSVPRPNVVIVLADDLGYGDVAALNPASRIPTPHLDALAAEGVLFTDAHSPSAVCTPTRYGLLTGRYCWRTELKNGVLDGYGAPLVEPARITIAELLRANGYRTAMVGKWHLGLRWTRDGDTIDFTAEVTGGPKDHGFDHSLILPASLDFPPYVWIEDGFVTDHHIVEQTGEPFPAFIRAGPRAADFSMEDALDRIVDGAAEQIRAGAAEEAPFFLYVALTAPHKPVLPHPRFRGATDLGDYGDFVVQVDAAVGRVVDALDAAGVADDTLVVVTSDNGSFMYRYEDGRTDHAEDSSVHGFRPETHRANGPWRGTKADIWEAGHRVPFVLRYPARVPAGERRDATICLTDLYATCAGLVGASPAPGQAEDSFDFFDAALDGAAVFERAPVIHHSVGGMFAIRDGAWKLVAGDGSGGRQQPRGTPFAEPYQLFDLGEDPGETNDVAARNSKVVTYLSWRLDQIRGVLHDLDPPEGPPAPSTP